MNLIFAAVAAPLLLFMLAWTLVTVCRICFPEKLFPVEGDPVAIRRRVAAGECVLVGAREICDAQRRHAREEACVRYTYSGSGVPGGFPSAWREDLWRRRN